MSAPDKDGWVDEAKVKLLQEYCAKLEAELLRMARENASLHDDVKHDQEVIKDQMNDLTATKEALARANLLIISLRRPALDK